MKRIQAFWQKQVQMMLSQRHTAIGYALAFAPLSYTSWLSTVIILLVTLRRGWLEGGIVLGPVLMVHMGVSTATLPFFAAFMNTLLLFVPCYSAACVLRLTVSWQGVAGFLFLFASLAVLAVQIWLPELVVAQYQYVLEILKLSHQTAISQMLQETSHINQQVMASFAFGVQLLSMVFSSMLSLMMARSMQSRLFNPGGFRQELLAFRATKVSLLIALLLSVAVMKYNPVAMMLLPLVFFYFMLAGLSLSANTLVRKNARLIVVVLVAPLFVLPFVMVPFYGMLGFLDGLFNLRQLNRKEEVK